MGKSSVPAALSLEFFQNEVSNSVLVCFGTLLHLGHSFLEHFSYGVAYDSFFLAPSQERREVRASLSQLEDKFSLVAFNQNTPNIQQRS